MKNKFKKRCSDCGDSCDIRDKEIIIKINHKDIEALEDRIFCSLDDKDYRKILLRLNKIWVQVCKGEDKWKK